MATPPDTLASTPDSLDSSPRNGPYSSKKRRCSGVKDLQDPICVERITDTVKTSCAYDTYLKYLPCCCESRA